MRSILRLLAVFALAITTFSQHRNASAAKIFHFKDKNAFAFFSTMDPSECIQTNVVVFASEEVVRNPPAPAEAGSRIELIISLYDVCKEKLLMDVETYAPLAGSDFQVSSKLDAATLNTTVQAFDELAGTEAEVSIHMTWMGTGRRTHQNNTYHFNTPGCPFSLHVNGPSRSAEASGTVSIGRTNYTPEPSDLATINSTNWGSVSVGCD